MPLKVSQKDGSITVRNEYWEVRHSLKDGGCWDSIKFAHGSGKNFLTAPVSGRIRVLEENPQSDNSSPHFYEQRFERRPKVEVRQEGGNVIVAVEGQYTLKDGKTLPARFRQTYTYGEWGLVTCDLEIQMLEERRDVVEVVAAEMHIRPGMTDFLWRDHPTCGRHVDLCGMGSWHTMDTARRGTWEARSHRYVPIHLVVFEKGGEGIEFMPQSNLGNWDTALNPSPGMGYYTVCPSWEVAGGTIVQISPYCVAYRRNPTTLSGAYRFRWYWTLPFIRKPETIGTHTFHCSAGSRWIPDEGLERLAKAGVRLIRFHNDYRKDGPFWHDGMYPPYDAEGMAHLRRIVNKAHDLGMKIVPYISVKELHPDTQEWKDHGQEWAHVPGPTFKEVHTWAGTGEFGQLECLESGWLDFRKKSIDIILSDLPWDGLYFDWETPHPCAHPGHMGGAIHTDQDAFIDFMYWARRRVGPDGVIFSHISGLPQIFVENMSTVMFIYEDLYRANVPNPDDFEPQVEFMPIVPRYLCSTANTPETIRRNIMSPLLAGAPATMGWPLVTGDGGGAMGTPKLAEQLCQEFELFGQDMSGYHFIPAYKRPVRTGGPSVYGAVWFSPTETWLYLGNFSDKAARGQAAIKADLPGLKGRRGPLTVQKRLPGGKSKELRLTAVEVRGDGIPYNLGPWASALYRIS